MNASEAEKKVRERWPDAKPCRWSNGVVIRRHIEGRYWGLPLGETKATEDDAWIDAAQRMEDEQ